MKKIVLITGFILFCFTATFAQQMQPLPIDPKVRYGKLDNGLTYYIRHNELPKGQADFYIAQNVGAILENDDQNGLAHFLEHMAFNGSTHFSGNEVISYLESIGVKFGYNLNAYTSFDRTVYNINNVPVTREGIVDSCLLILHDWSGALLLEEKDIDKERGVIVEEKRSRGGASWRIFEKLIPQIIPNSQYAKRNLIGEEDFLKTFKPEVLRAYYKKWYRPDLQGLIIVGDIDVDQVENKLKVLFADIPAPVNPAERIYYPVEDNDETLVGIVSDKEATSIDLSIDFKHEALPREMRGSIVAYVTNHFNSLLRTIMQERFAEFTQQANPPFVRAGLSNGLFAIAATKESLSGDVTIKGNEVELGFKTLIHEIERLKQFGFTASEFQRATTNRLTRYENSFKDKDKKENGSYTGSYINHFTEGTYIPGIEMEYNLLNSITPQITLEQFNSYVKELIRDKNIVITGSFPEKEGVIVPSKEQLLTWFNEARKDEVKPYEEKVSNEPLLSELPKGGKIVKVAQDKIFDATVYTLSNGVKVVVKPTQNKDNEIVMSATSPGGTSLFPENDPINIQQYNAVANLGGLGNFSRNDLNKALTGKKVSVSPAVNLTTEKFSGNSAVKDFETMLQLIYLNFTSPRTDEDAYQAYLSKMKSQLESMEVHPQMALQDTLNKEIYVNQTRNARLKAADLDKVNYQTIMNWRKDRFKDASDFTFVFVGNIDPVASKDLIAQYLGSLPSIKRKESFAKINMDYQKGIKQNHFDKVMENPKATVIDIYWTTLDYNLANRLKLNMLSQILNILYQEKVREDEGGTYGVNAYAGMVNYPKGRTMMQIAFETDPAKKDYLAEIIHKEFKSLVENGPRSEDFQKAKEFLLKQYQENLENNQYWVNVISTFYEEGYDGYTNYVNAVNAITHEDVRKTAKSLLDAQNMIEVIMTGVKE
jgi:zinc protease